MITNQKDLFGSKISGETYQLVMVDNNSTDKSVEIIQKFMDNHKDIRVYLIHEKDKGVIPARIAGFRYATLDSAIQKSKYLASVDSDTILHENWVVKMLDYFETTDADVLSFAGCYPYDFWTKLPETTKKYAREVGTIFFSSETIAWLDEPLNHYLFTEQIFFDFQRFITDTCYAVKRESYLRAGGYIREFYDQDCRNEVYGEGWRLLFRMERMGAKLVYVNSVPYMANPRRMLKEPEKFLNGNSYSDVMSDVRATSMNEYEVLEEMSKKIDFGPVKRKYVLDYYILLRTIIKPEYILIHEKYFTGFSKELFLTIQKWWESNPEPKGQEVFRFCEDLGKIYSDRVLDNIISKMMIPKFSSHQERSYQKNEK